MRGSQSSPQERSQWFDEVGAGASMPSRRAENPFSAGARPAAPVNIPSTGGAPGSVCHQTSGSGDGRANRFPSPRLWSIRPPRSGLALRLSRFVFDSPADPTPATALATDPIATNVIADSTMLAAAGFDQQRGRIVNNVIYNVLPGGHWVSGPGGPPLGNATMAFAASG